MVDLAVVRVIRAPHEIQRAHDILEAVVLGEVIATPPNDGAEAAMHATIDALCWVLRHDHNPAFATNLAKLERNIAAAGYVLRRT